MYRHFISYPHFKMKNIFTSPIYNELNTEKEVNKLIEYKELPHKYVSMMKAFFAFVQNSELHWNSHLPHYMFLKQFYSISQKI